MQFQFTYWQAQQAKYDKVNLSLITLLQAIQDTVPTEIKRAIALHTTPSAAYHAVTETYKAQHVQVLQRLETQWHNLFNQASGYELIAWLDKLNTLYKRLEDLQSHTIHNAAQQLLLAIQIQNETIATIYSTTLGPTPDFITILSSYKNYLNQQKARNEHQQHVQIGYAAHAAQPSQPPPQQSQPTTTGRGGRSGRGGRGANAASDAQGPRQPCSCGNNHSLRKCYYLNPQLRLSGWKPGKTGSEKIAQDLQQGDHRRIHIERILGHAIPADMLALASPSTLKQAYPASSQYLTAPPSRSPGTSTSSSPVPASPALVPDEITYPQHQFPQYSANAVSVLPRDDGTYPLNMVPTPKPQIATFSIGLAYQNWWLLDSACPIHIGKDRDAFAFYDEFTPEQRFTIAHGRNSVTTVIGKGSVPLILTLPNGTTVSRMVPDVYHIPGFLANLISVTHWEKKHKLWIQPKYNQIIDVADQPVYQFTKEHDNYVIAKQVDYSRTEQRKSLVNSASRPNSQSTAFHNSRIPHPVAPATTKIWHDRLGHPGRDVIDHLKEHTDAVITQSSTTLGGGDCEACRLAKATQQISRVPTTRGEYPMDFVHFDLIHYHRALNGARYLFHLIDTHSGFHVVQDFRDRSAPTIQPYILGFAQWVLNQGSRVRHLHTDDERALLGFNQYLQHRGIEFTRSSPYNANQNPHAERAGSVLTTLIRTMLIHAGLPETLWPWVAHAAAYILNRRPTQRLQWHTPTEILYKGKKQSLRAIRVIGCKAYVLRKTRPQGDKLSPRVWIGYLVGFQASNIWHIWDPASQRVITARDVQFDESALYKDTLRDIPQLTQHTPDDTTIIN